MNVLKAVSSCLLIVAVVLAFFISGIRLFGFQVFGVLSGSMEPTYPTGSLIYVKPAAQNELRVNDIITFSLSPNVIATHRIVELVQDENNPAMVRYRTKGDANRDVDTDLVSYGSIIGKASFCVPMLGHFASYIQKPPGLYVALVICVLMIGFVFLTDTLEIQSRKNKKRKRQPAQAPQKTSRRAAPADEQDDFAQRPRRSQQRADDGAGYDYQSRTRQQQDYASRQYAQQSRYGQQAYAQQYERPYSQQSRQNEANRQYNPQGYGNQQYSQRQYHPQDYANQQYGRSYSQQGYANQQYGQQSQNGQQGYAGSQYRQQEYPNWQRPQYARQQEQQTGAPAQGAEQQYYRRASQGYQRQTRQDGQNGQS